MKFLFALLFVSFISVSLCAPSFQECSCIAGSVCSCCFSATSNMYCTNVTWVKEGLQLAFYANNKPIYFDIFNTPVSNFFSECVTNADLGICILPLQIQFAGFEKTASGNFTITVTQNKQVYAQSFDFTLHDIKENSVAVAKKRFPELLGACEEGGCNCTTNGCYCCSTTVPVYLLANAHGFKISGTVDVNTFMIYNGQSWATTISFFNSSSPVAPQLACSPSFSQPSTTACLLLTQTSPDYNPFIASLSFMTPGGSPSVIGSISATLE